MSGTTVLRWRDADVRCFVLCATGEGINALFDMIDVAFGYDDGVLRA